MTEREVQPDEYDMDDITSVIAELRDSVAYSGPYSGLDATDPAEQVRAVARVAFLASRVAWLGASEMTRVARLAQPGVAPDGIGDPLPDRVVAGELLRRATTAGLSAEHQLALLGRLVPDLGCADLHALMAGAQARAAQAEVTASDLSAMALLVARYPDGTTGRQAIEQAGIDPDRYIGAVTRLAAERSCAVGELEWDAISEAIEAARAGEGS